MSLVIVGCGGHARSVACSFMKYSNENIVFLDENAKPNEEIFGFPVINDYEITEQDQYFVAIGDNEKRRLFLDSFRHKGRLISIVDCEVHVSQNAKIGAGCFVGSGAYVGPYAEIGVGTIINTGAIVEHEVIVGSNSHVAPAATICGRTKVGNNVMIGAGSTVIDSIEICDNVTVGAGSTVVHDILNPGTYVGVPAHMVNNDFEKKRDDR